MKVEIRGTEALAKAIQGVRVTKIKAGIRKGSRAGAKIVQAAAQAMMPVKTGRAKKSLRVRALPRSRKRVGAQLTSVVAGTPARHISFLELGTKKMAAKSPIRRAVEQTKTAAGQTFVDGILQELERR